jgi:hypothetical protein
MSIPHGHVRNEQTADVLALPSNDDLRQRWPMLRRRGAGTCNAIADSAEQLLARAARPRRRDDDEPATVGDVRKINRRLRKLAEAIGWLNGGAGK